MINYFFLSGLARYANETYIHRLGLHGKIWSPASRFKISYRDSQFALITRIPSWNSCACRVASSPRHKETLRLCACSGNAAILSSFAGNQMSRWSLIHCKITLLLWLMCNHTKKKVAGNLIKKIPCLSLRLRASQGNDEILPWFAGDQIKIVFSVCIMHKTMIKT